MQNDSFKMRQHYAPYNRSEESHRKSAEVYALSLKSWDISLALNMTVLFLHVILSMSSEQTCLQGFANEDIHKAQAFCKNAKR